MRGLVLLTALVAVATPGGMAEGQVADDLEAWVPVPFRVRNLTFPTVLVMGFKPAPAASLGRGIWAAELEFQLTVGIAWEVSGGRLGLGATENLFNYDNTPDFAVHLSCGLRFGRSSPPAAS